MRVCLTYECMCVILGCVYMLYVLACIYVRIHNMFQCMFTICDLPCQNETLLTGAYNDIRAKTLRHRFIFSKMTFQRQSFLNSMI